MDLNGHRSNVNKDPNGFPERRQAVKAKDKRLAEQAMCDSCYKRPLRAIDPGGLCRVCSKDLDVDIDVADEVRQQAVPVHWRGI